MTKPRKCSMCGDMVTPHMCTTPPQSDDPSPSKGLEKLQAGKEGGTTKTPPTKIEYYLPKDQQRRVLAVNTGKEDSTNTSGDGDKLYYFDFNKNGHATLYLVDRKTLELQEAVDRTVRFYKQLARQQVENVLDRVEAEVIGEDTMLTKEEADGKCEDLSTNINAYMKEAKNSLRAKQREALASLTDNTKDNQTARRRAAGGTAAPGTVSKT